MKRKSIKNIEKQADDPVCFSFVSRGSNRVNETQKNNQKVRKIVKSIDSSC